MRKTLSSRRISSAMASRSASRTVSVTVSPVHSFSAGAGFSCAAGARGAAGALGFSGFASALASAASSTGASCAGVEGLGAGLPAALGGSALAASSTASPSPAITAIGAFTATFSVPSGTRILASVPSSTASISMVALSVSISASTSPAATLSPGCLCHFASLPSVIVGESAGISTSIGIAPSRVRVDIGPELGRVRLRALLREIRGSGDDVLDLLVDLFELSLIRHAAIDEALLDLVDGVVLLAHPAHFVARAVFRRVGHGVAAIAVGLHLEDVGPFAAPHMFHRIFDRLLHRDDVHAIDLVARNVEGRAAADEIMRGGTARDRGPHAVAVVLDDVEHRQLPQRRHVEALIDLALVHRAVAQEGDADLAVVAIPVREAHAGADRHLRADDAVAAEEVLLAAEHVHRAAFPAGIAAAPPGEFGHDALGIHA